MDGFDSDTKVDTDIANASKGYSFCDCDSDCDSDGCGTSRHVMSCHVMSRKAESAQVDGLCLIIGAV